MPARTAWAFNSARMTRPRVSSRTAATVLVTIANRGGTRGLAVAFGNPRLFAVAHDLPAQLLFVVCDLPREFDDVRPRRVFSRVDGLWALLCHRLDRSFLMRHRPGRHMATEASDDGKLGSGRIAKPRAAL